MQDLQKPLGHSLTLFEYGTCDDSQQADLLFAQQAALQPYLKEGWLNLSFDGAKPCIRAAGYVGVLPFVVNGKSHLLLVAPKGCRTDMKVGMRHFLELLAFEKDQEMPEIPGWKGTNGPHVFLLFLAHFYARQLKDLCRRDFRSYYRAEEGDLRSFIRGRLNRPAYARLAVRGKPHILPCRWDEFTVDNWDNRILWAVARRLKKVAGLLDSEAARQVWEPFRSLVSWFGSVADVPITAADFRKSRLGRMSRYYRHALTWARLLLQGSDLPTVDGRVPPLILKSWEAFEHFAEAVARTALPDPSWSHHFKEKWLFLTGHQQSHRVPDIFLSGPGNMCAVGDSKYKQVLENVTQRAEESSLRTAEGAVDVGIKEPDWNQLYVYMRMKGARSGFFIVPFWDATGPHSKLLIENFQFIKSPCDDGVRLAVLGLNLLKPLKNVKSEAADKLKNWLRYSTG